MPENTTPDAGTTPEELVESIRTTVLIATITAEARTGARLEPKASGD
jgi:hypothetical protein